MYFDFNAFNACMNYIMPIVAAMVLVTLIMAVFGVMIMTYLVVASACGLIGRIYQRLRGHGYATRGLR